MTGQRPQWWNGERKLMLAGLTGAAMVVGVACSEEDGMTGSEADAGGTTGETADGTGDSGTTQTSTAECGEGAGRAEHTAAVVEAANALYDSLQSDQQSTIQYDFSLENAAVWSNFPTTFVQRNGVSLADMSADAQTAALALAEVAAGETGATFFDELREADEFLVTDGGASSTDYSRDLYYFAFIGSPSTSSAWGLQIGGHHLAYNFTYGGSCAGATPLFDGAEPMDYTDADGVEHSPLEAQRSAMVALVESVQSEADAQLSGSFGDLVNGPAGGGPGGGSGGDSKYPSSLSYPTGTTGRGVLVSSLSEAQQELVKTAIEAWVDNVADPVASALLEQYESDAAFAETYVGYAGSADLSTQGSYVRIDGPRVWIEASVQGGIVYRDVVHYHTIWRDKVADYGAEFASE